MLGLIAQVFIGAVTFWALAIRTPNSNMNSGIETAADKA